MENNNIETGGAQTNESEHESAKAAPQIIWQDRKHHLWFPFSFTKYVVKNNRLMIHRGFFNSQLDETLLYRIVDLSMNQTLLGKLFGTGNITVTNRVDTQPVTVLENIKHPVQVYEILSEAVENSRKTQNVVGKEFYGSRGSSPFHGHHDGCGGPEDFDEGHGHIDFDEDGHEMDGEL